MDSILVRFESSDRPVAERIEQYLAQQDLRVIQCQRASAIRIAGLGNHTANRPTEVEALQEILEIASARVRRRLTERFDLSSLHHLSRGIRNHEHRQRRGRRVRGMGQTAVPFHQRAHRHRPVLSADQQDHHQQDHHRQGEDVVHEPIARLHGDQDHGQERVDDIVNEQIARLEGLQLQDPVGNHPVLSPVLPTEMHAEIEEYLL